MTYHRLFETHHFSQEELKELREANYLAATEDRLRCQHCQGFYWRLWWDMAQCLGCQHYTMIEVGQKADEKQLEFGFAYNPYENTLLAVEWIAQQLNGKDGNTPREKIKDPLSDRTEFLIFPDRLKCRVTSTETLIQPKISGYWILKEKPKVDNPSLITADKALQLVRSRQEERANDHGDGKRDGRKYQD